MCIELRREHILFNIAIFNSGCPDFRIFIRVLEHELQNLNNGINFTG